jgi:hypothetical protein
MSTSTPEPADSNDLQRWLFEFRQSVDKNINKIIAGVVIATIAIVAYQVVTRSAAAKKAAQWNEYHACASAEDYTKVAEKFPGTTVEHWARLEAARRFIQIGVTQSQTNRVTSDENLNSGKTQLEKLLNTPGTPEEVREHALSQLAVCLESLCDGNTQTVIDAYEKLIKDFPVSQYVPWAKSRIEFLKKPSTGEFYAWFRKTKPSPADRPKPQDVNLDEVPNIKLDGESLTPPVPGETPAAETKPEGEKPAEAAPAAETKPAEPAPPTEPAAPEKTEAEKTEAAPPAEPAAPAAEPAPPAEKPADKPQEPAAEAPKSE